MYTRDMNATATLQQWGNSQGIRLTKDVLAPLGIAVGDALQIHTDGKILTIKPKPHRLQDMTLDEILNTIPDNYKTCEYDMGAPVGKEVW